MNFFDDENKIIEWLQDVECSSVCFPIENDELVEIFESIHNEEQWKLWKNSSGKSDPPPDFYCDKLKLMMDVMRVDDHAYKNKKGKIVNQTNAQESAMQKELRQSGILDRFPNVKNIICNAMTDLPTEQNHNYKFYKNNFIRTIEEHKRKIDLYKQNHPGFKTLFFILDESSAYFESEQNREAIIDETHIKGYPHFWLLDQAFTNVFMGSEIDYVIWFAPYKQEHLFCNIILPEVVVYNTNEHLDSRNYKIDNMISCEK